MIICRRVLARKPTDLLWSKRWQPVRLSSNAGTTSSTTVSSVFLEHARSIATTHDELNQELAASYNLKTARQVGELSNTVTALRKWESVSKSIKELQDLLNEPSVDSELRSLATADLAEATAELDTVSTNLTRSLVPVHPFTHLPCLLELRPGAGGAEAGLFAAELLAMYQAYCIRNGLRASILKYEAAEGQGSGDQVEEAILEIEGDNAYGLLRCEAGVHRVQRVPATESKGRTHTSAVSVLVLPSFPSTTSEDTGENNFNDPTSDYYIDPSDVRTDVMRARGAGGQHVNTTDSAVRLTHIPTKTVVSIQDSRSQHRNREKAWRILRSKIAQAKREAREEELASIRASVIGVAKMGFGDKIRTYNWGQHRVTDHRSGITLNHLSGVLEGGEKLEEVMGSVRAWMMERDLEGLAADEMVKRKALTGR